MELLVKKALGSDLYLISVRLISEQQKREQEKEGKNTIRRKRMYIATFKTQTGPHRDFEFIDVATDEEAIREAQESAYKRGETVGSVYLLGRMVYSR